VGERVELLVKIFLALEAAAAEELQELM